MRIKSYWDATLARASFSRYSRRSMGIISTEAPARALLAGSTSLYLVWTMALSTGAPLMSTSYTVGNTAPLSTPNPEVALPWGSKSQTSTLAPTAWRQEPKFTQLVVFPTPPFWLTKAMVLAMVSLPFPGLPVTAKSYHIPGLYQLTAGLNYTPFHRFFARDIWEKAGVFPGNSTAGQGSFGEFPGGKKDGCFT